MTSNMDYENENGRYEGKPMSLPLSHRVYHAGICRILGWFARYELQLSSS